MHKCVISECSYIKIRLTTNVGNKINDTMKTDLSDDVLRFLLIHIYTGNIDIQKFENNVHELIELFDAINMWLIDNLWYINQIKSKEHLLSNLNKIIVTNFIIFIDKDIMIINKILNRFYDRFTKNLLHQQIQSYFAKSSEKLT